MKKLQKKKKCKGGRPLKGNPSIHRYVFRLTDEENAKFLSLFEASGAPNKAQFVISVLFEKPIKSVKVDVATMEYYTRLTALFGQFRAIGVNYNQVVRLLHRHFSQKKAAAFLFKLEKQTAALSKLCRDIMALTSEFEAKYVNQNNKT